MEFWRANILLRAPSKDKGVKHLLKRICLSGASLRSIFFFFLFFEFVLVADLLLVLVRRFHMENSKFNCLYPMTTFCGVNFRLRLDKVNKKRMVLNAQRPCERWESWCLILLNAQWFSCVSSKLTVLLCLIYQIWFIPQWSNLTYTPCEDSPW